MDKVLYLLTLILAHVSFTTARLHFTCDPDVYPASHFDELIVTYNATLDEHIDTIDYTYNTSMIWTYNLDYGSVSNLTYLVVDADPPAVNSSSHQFTITMNRCAGDGNRDVVIRARIVTQDFYYYNQRTILSIEKVPGTLSMTVDDDVVSCGDDVIVKNGSPTITCTLTGAYPEPGRFTLLHNGQGMIQTDGPMLNNGKCLYYLTTTSVTHITNGHKHNITCISGNETCSIILEREVPGTLSMTVDDDVVSCGDDVIVKNGSPTITCTITEAYPEPGRVALLLDGHNMIQSDGPMLNNGNYLYTSTTYSEIYITYEHKPNITCISGSQTCSITLQRACDVGAYGVNCKKVCHCSACDHMTGCSGGCTDGYTGEFCTIAPEGNSGTPVWMIVVINVVVVGIFAAASAVLWIYCYKKKIQASRTKAVDPKITGKDVVKINEVYTYIDVDRTKNVAYTVPTTDINGVYITPIITEVKSDYKADDPCSKADDPRSKVDDPRNKADDPCSKADDPCSKADDPCSKADGPCSKADDPRSKADDPCSKADDPCSKADDPCSKADDPCSEADDPYSKADDPCSKADENNNDKQPSATETIDPNTRQPYENVEFDGSNNEDEIYMTPISESTTD